MIRMTVYVIDIRYSIYNISNGSNGMIEVQQ